MKHLVLTFSLLLLAGMLSACTAQQPTAAPSLTPLPPTPTPSAPPPTPTATALPEPQALQPGDAVGEMLLRQAPGEQVMDALLWNYCLPSIGDEQGNPALRQCSVPQFPYLFIGSGMGGMSGDEMDAAWASIRWELYLDGLPVDLEAFAPVDFPDSGFRLWNVGIEAPSMGQHTLRYVIFPLNEPGKSYETTWEITVKDPSEFPALSIVYPAQPTPLPEPAQPVRTGTGGLPWWNDQVFYEVFVRSFKDSDGDGIGDLNGLISMLDYLNDGEMTWV